MSSKFLIDCNKWPIGKKLRHIRLTTLVIAILSVCLTAAEAQNWSHCFSIQRVGSHCEMFNECGFPFYVRWKDQGSVCSQGRGCGTMIRGKSQTVVCPIGRYSILEIEEQ
jgi:hypothetical protein